MILPQRQGYLKIELIVRNPPVIIPAIGAIELVLRAVAVITTLLALTENADQYVVNPLHSNGKDNKKNINTKKGTEKKSIPSLLS